MKCSPLRSPQLLSLLCAPLLWGGLTSCASGHTPPSRSLSGDEGPTLHPEGAALTTEQEFTLGVAFETGQGVDVAPSRAAQYYRAACAGGHTLACNNLGVLLHDGRGVPVDRRAAAELFEGACEGGDAEGCFNLALAYEEGQGRGADPVAARAYFLRACRGHQLDACLNHALMALRGEGGPRDVSAAATSFDGACRLGELPACFNLGVIAEAAGRQEISREAFDKACRGGLDRACAALEK